MYPASRTQTEEVRRHQILAAARKVFAEKGYDSATVADIVAVAGVAQGTFYLYFPSKRAVVIALAEMYLSQMASEVMAAYDPAWPPAESIRPMVHAAFVVCNGNRDLARLFRFTLDVEAAEALEGVRARQTFISTIAEILAQGMKQGWINPMDAEVAARLINNLVRDACHECYVFGDGSEAQRYEDAVVALLTNALVKKG